MKCICSNNLFPCCRGDLQEKEEHEIKTDTEDEEDDEDDEDEYDDEDDEDENTDEDSTITIEDNEDEEDEDESYCSVEYIEKIMKEKNITYANILNVLIDRFPKNTSSRMKHKTEKSIFDIVNMLDDDTNKECLERTEMEKEEKLMKVFLEEESLIKNDNEIKEIMNVLICKVEEKTL
jgi:hypothetical protein